MRKLLAHVLAVGLLIGVSAQIFAQSQESIPAEFSCAKFPPDLTESDLIEIFGEANVSDSPVVGSDDGPVPSSVVYANDPARRLEVAWRDSQAKRNPAWIIVREDAREWHSPHGISPGATLRQVEAENASPFGLGGFMLESGQGMVRTWGSGSLQKFEDPDCPLKIQFQPRRHSDADFSLAAQLARGNNFSSGHPAMQAANPIVVGLWIWYGW